MSRPALVKSQHLCESSMFWRHKRRGWGAVACGRHSVVLLTADRLSMFAACRHFRTKKSNESQTSPNINCTLGGSCFSEPLKKTRKSNDERRNMGSWFLATFGDVRKDRGLLIMNAGSVLALTGFLMTDVLHLRTLSISGSICGMIYNYTRSPRQFNAIGWGLVFMTVNCVQVARLLLEKDPAFTEKEVELYTEHFKQWGVTLEQFRKLLRAVNWKIAHAGETIVPIREPLSAVILVHKGRACALDEQNECLYVYDGASAGRNLIGGTALLDETVLKDPSGKGYPNAVVAETDVEWVEWDIFELRRMMEHDHVLENAILHALYVELVQSLRNRSDSQEKSLQASRRAPHIVKSQLVLPDDASTAGNQMSLGKEVSSVLEKLDTFEAMAKNCINGATIAPETRKYGTSAWSGLREVLDPKMKREVRAFVEEAGINNHQREHVLWKFGWTLGDWDDGFRFVEDVLRKPSMTGSSVREVDC